MKILIMLGLLMMFSTSVFAETCSANLKDRRTNDILNTYNVTDYDHTYACTRAMEVCERELRWGYYPNGFCELADDNRQPPTPPPSRYYQVRCDVGLIDYNRIIRGFSAVAADYNYRAAQDRACYAALNMCQHYRGWNQQCRVIGIR